jgi:hypothetical protein
VWRIVLLSMAAAVLAVLVIVLAGGPVGLIRLPHIPWAVDRMLWLPALGLILAVTAFTLAGARAPDARWRHATTLVAVLAGLVHLAPVGRLAAMQALHVSLRASVLLGKLG